MSCSHQYSPQLRARGYRMTPQRLAILHVLHHSKTHLSPAQVYKLAKKDLPGLTEPTVYRTLEFLVKNGLAHPAHKHKGHMVYEIAHSEHHHLTCRACGAELELPAELLKSLYLAVEKHSGYALTDTHLTLFGLCPRCQSQVS